MKRYLPLETCKKLIEMGCTSQSDMGRPGHHKNLEIMHKPASMVKYDKYHPKEAAQWIPAFEFEDLFGPSSHAIENLKKIFPKTEPLDGSWFNYKSYKYSIYDEGADWVKIIEEAVDGLE